MAFNHEGRLQSAIYERLSAYEELQGIPVFDAPPLDLDLPDTYIRLGEEFSSNASSQTHSAVKVRFPIHVYDKANGFSRSKTVASQVVAALETDLQITAAEIVYLNFLKSQSYLLEKGNLRLIRLWFGTLIHNT
jgi:hypothetical protein